MWLLRQIESEITQILCYPSSGLAKALSNEAFSQWFTRIHERLNEWHRMTRQSVNLSERIEFHELMFQVQMLKLNRPSPRCPDPTTEMRTQTFKSSIALLKEFSVIDRLGKLFNIWHAAHCIVEAGICLLASVLSGIEPRGHNLTDLGGEDITILMKYMKTFPFLLWQVSRRWSNIARHASTLEAISLSVLEKLQQWSNGETIESSEFDVLKQKLKDVALFSPFPPESPPGVEEHALPVVNNGGNIEEVSNMVVYQGIINDSNTTGNELLQSSTSTSIPLDTYHNFNHQNLTPDVASLNSSWVSPQPPQRPGSLMYTDPVGIGDGDILRWDFAGMDPEEIFHALLVGGEFPLPTDEFGVGDNNLASFDFRPEGQ